MDCIPRYRTNVSKALETILWLATRQAGIDVYHVVKACYFADKHHVSRYGRPICGDSYEAAPFGPLPQIVYGLLRSDPIEMLALGGNGDLPFVVDRQHRVTAKREANLRLLSESDAEALAFALDHVRNRSFNDLFEETHSDPAYVKATGGRMDYRDMISDEDPARDDKRAYIEETSSQFAI